MGGLVWVTAGCSRILWGVFERRESKILRRHLSEPPTTWFWEGCILKYMWHHTQEISVPCWSALMVNAPALTNFPTEVMKLTFLSKEWDVYHFGLIPLPQVGHEPIAPTPVRTFSGRKVLWLPSFFQYGEFEFSLAAQWECAALSWKPPTLFQTKTCDFPYSISDLTPKMHTLLQTPQVTVLVSLNLVTLIWHIFFFGDGFFAQLFFHLLCKCMWQPHVITAKIIPQSKPTE